MKPNDPDSKRKHELLEQFADLIAEKLHARLAAAPLAKTSGEELITSRNYEAHFPGRNWRAVQAFCQRSGLTKLRIGGTPAYRRVDIEAALAKTAKTPEPVKPEDDVDAAYLKLVRGAK
jgi:hypothetical protein